MIYKNKMKRTKMVCTLGPATDSENILESMIHLGLNVVRMNFSHGSHEEHAARITKVKQVRKKLCIPVAIMLDTKGPEIRTGLLKEEKINLEKGQTFVLTTEDIKGDSQRVSVSYPGLINDVKVGDRILIDDGLIELDITEIKDTEIICIVENGGEIGARKGVNVPNVPISLPGLTEKDKSDLIFGVQQGIDFVAASFIRKPQDVIAIRKVLDNNGGGHIQIISKIENREGVEKIDRILAVSDGIMVARGDLGVEIPAEEVPLVQKNIIKKCNMLGKPVIIATQMLDSMIRNPRPTRAEVGDVANAVFDGADAVMLSGETAVGSYPLQAVETMANIVSKTETSEPYRNRTKPEHGELSITNAVCEAIVSIAENLNTKAIIAATSSGLTARMLSKYRPDCMILASSDKMTTVRRLTLTWGVYCIYVPEFNDTDMLIHDSVDAAVKLGSLKLGDIVVVAAGVPIGIAGNTNMISVHTVGNAAISGQGIGEGFVVGNAKLIDGDNVEEFKEGDILVLRNLTRDLEWLLTKAGAIITVESGVDSDGAKAASEYNIPAIIGADKALELITHGNIITVDTKRGMIYQGRMGQSYK